MRSGEACFSGLFSRGLEAIDCRPRSVPSMAASDGKRLLCYWCGYSIDILIERRRKTFNCETDGFDVRIRNNVV